MFSDLIVYYGVNILKKKMKTRFNSYDIVCIVAELQSLIGMRVNNVYDIDNKTYLIKLQRGEEKSVLLFESGNRLHTTNFEWPKNIAPSGFSMKMRKHIKNKRLESMVQLGSDRIVVFQFGTGQAAYHIIIELYDRGNVILTDYEMTILNVLRPHTEGDRVKFVVREKYPENRARENAIATEDDLKEIFKLAKVGEPIKKILMPHLDYGPSLTEHVLLKHGFTNASKIGKTFNTETDTQELLLAIEDAKMLMNNAKINPSKGYIIQKKEERPRSETEKEYFFSNQEFHPALLQQHTNQPYQEFDSFNTAVDEFFSNLEGQKIEMRAVQQEREAVKKLENIKKDHVQRLIALEKAQENDEEKAELITRNQNLVDSAILAIQAALASQTSWNDIDALVKDAAAKGDSVATHIKQLKLDTNHISLYLTDPYKDYGQSEENTDDEHDDDDEKVNKALAPQIIDIDLALTAFANARRYYSQRRTAARKQQKTIESQGKALKSAEKKTKQTLKEVQLITNINKARKFYWFEKFFWFISSENYLVIAGRDQQQNELIVKRYMKPNDIYVHADIHGACSVVIKNPTGLLIPPKTLNEAGTMAICYSVAWEAKVITNAYWVLGEQVSKTAPTGEYLTTGSFMIRGKKNFLPPSHLILGLSFLFRLEESCIEKHNGERKIMAGTDDSVSIADSELSLDEVEVEVLDESDEDNEEKNVIANVEAKEQDSDDITNEPSSRSNASDLEEDSQFPDTQIKIQHFEGTKVNIIAEPVITVNENSAQIEQIFLGDNKPVTYNPQLNQVIGSKNRKPQVQKVLEPKDYNTKQAQSKRGQKSKLKKIKEKYKDQDEEERKLRMEILKSAGTPKDQKKSKGKDTQNIKHKKDGLRIQRILSQRTEKLDEPDEDDVVAQVEVDMIDTLTGQPVVDDELLFAIPVIAPYASLTNYKFKVKITPGTGKRGKAARVAVSMFLRDRTTTQRERDLLKAVKDEQLARNLPGKVKISAPRLNVIRK